MSEFCTIMSKNNCYLGNHLVFCFDRDPTVEEMTC